MSLSHAILGFLHQEPMTGYDLKTQGFDRSVTHFWPADQAQIYRTLDKLAEQGLVESRIEVQEDRPNRKVYSITEAGKAELRQWLLSELPLSMSREPFLVQLFFTHQLSNDEILELLRGQLQLHEEVLALYQEIPIPLSDDPLEERRRSLQRMTRDLGISFQKTYVDWLKRCIQTVEQFETDV